MSDTIAAILVGISFCALVFLVLKTFLAMLALSLHAL